jgi:hypothetical protein
MGERCDRKLCFPISDLPARFLMFLLHDLRSSILTIFKPLPVFTCFAGKVRDSFIIFYGRESRSQYGKIVFNKTV